VRTIDTAGVRAPQAVAVVGLGLIGASLCRALRERLPDMGIVGIARRGETAERAMDDGICDLAGTMPNLLRHADLAVLCTPVSAMPPWLDACAAHDELLVTDCGSSKQWIVEQARQRIDPRRFLGGHPMAGRERSGYDAADATLFSGAVWVLTPSDAQQLERFAPWVDAVRALGAEIEVVDAAAHDRAAAWVSHLPFALSAALMRAAASSPDWPEGARLAASGFRDMARLAGGDPAMYGAIVETNGAAMADALDAYRRELDRLARTLRGRDGAAGYFAAAQQLRAAWLREREGGGRPVR
jgi:prephenate dehydrogenase